MNNLYIFTIFDSRLFVAEKNWKAARNYLIRLPEYKRKIRLTDIEGRRIKIGCTEEIGIMSIEQVFSLMPWWKCKCGNESFKVLDNGAACRCKKCNREARVSFP